VFIVVYFIINSVQKLLDTSLYIPLWTQSRNFWIHPHAYWTQTHVDGAATLYQMANVMTCSRFH